MLAIMTLYIYICLGNFRRKTEFNINANNHSITITSHYDLNWSDLIKCLSLPSVASGK